MIKKRYFCCIKKRLKNMRVLLVNTSERTGGAAVAAGRLMEALRKQGIDVQMVVRDRESAAPGVVAVGNRCLMRWRFLWERIVVWVANRLRRHQLFAVDAAYAGTDITHTEAFEQADIVHLHWVNQGFLSLGDIRRILDSGKPVVWTLHDLWPCTGICHYPGECSRFRSRCHNCPLLWNGGSRHDLSWRTFRRKERTYRGRTLHLVSCSRWLGEMARSSALCRDMPVTSIPNPIDISLFAPADKIEARRRCGFPLDKKLLLFGSVKVSDKRKGFDYLAESLHIILEKNPHLKETLAVVVMGRCTQELEEKLPVPVYSTGYVEEVARMAEIYNAADLFVIPSLEDNLPNTVMESMACGTPCVGFDTGGIPEMIDHGRNGYVARHKSAEDFARGIIVLLQEADYPAYALAAREKVVTTYAPDVVAARYIALYREEMEKCKNR